MLTCCLLLPSKPCMHNSCCKIPENYFSKRGASVKWALSRVKKGERDWMTSARRDVCPTLDSSWAAIKMSKFSPRMYEQTNCVFYDVFTTLDCFLIYSNQHQFSLDLLHMSLFFSPLSVAACLFMSFYATKSLWIFIHHKKFAAHTRRLLKFDYPFIPFLWIFILRSFFSPCSVNIHLESRDKGVEILRAIIK
jgi:hypothetical protein